MVLVMLLVVNSRLFFKFLLIVWLLKVFLMLLLILFSGGGLEFSVGLIIEGVMGDLLNMLFVGDSVIFWVLGFRCVCGDFVCEKKK